MVKYVSFNVCRAVCQERVHDMVGADGTPLVWSIDILVEAYSILRVETIRKHLRSMELYELVERVGAAWAPVQARPKVLWRLTPKGLALALSGTIAPPVATVDGGGT